MGRGNTCRFILKRACTIEALSSADRALCVVGRLEWKKKERARGTMGREKREERPFSLFPSSPPPSPPRAFNFSFIFAIFIGTPSGSLWGDQISWIRDHKGNRNSENESVWKIAETSLRRQDHANPVNILATRAGKMGFPALVPQKSCLYRLVINPLLTKLVRSRWLSNVQVIFAFLLTTTSSRPIKTQQTNLANIPPSWPNKLGQF